VSLHNVPAIGCHGYAQGTEMVRERPEMSAFSKRPYEAPSLDALGEDRKKAQFGRKVEKGLLSMIITYLRHNRED